MTSESKLNLNLPIYEQAADWLLFDGRAPRAALGSQVGGGRRGRGVVGHGVLRWRLGGENGNYIVDSALRKYFVFVSVLTS